MVDVIVAYNMFDKSMNVVPSVVLSAIGEEIKSYGFDVSELMNFGTNCCMLSVYFPQRNMDRVVVWTETYYFNIFHKFNENILEFLLCCDNKINNALEIRKSILEIAEESKLIVAYNIIRVEIDDEANFNVFMEFIKKIAIRMV